MDPVPPVLLRTKHCVVCIRRLYVQRFASKMFYNDQLHREAFARGGERGDVHVLRASYTKVNSNTVCNYFDYRRTGGPILGGAAAFLP